MKKFFTIALIVAFVLGIVSGLFYRLDLNSATDIIFLFSFKKVFLIFVVLLSIIIISLIGIPISFGVLILNIIISGFITSNFVFNYGLNGLLFIVLFLLIFKLFKMFLLILNSFYSFKISKNIYKFIFNRKLYKGKNVIIYIKKIVIVSIILFINELLLMIMGSKILTYFASHLLLK